MKTPRLAFALVMALAAPAAWTAAASDPDPLGGMVAVTPRRVVEPETVARDPDPGAAVKPGFFDNVHGEVGAVVGTNGLRGAFGTVGMPLGEDGYATFSFEDYRYGKHH